jgi:hypothetical protein
MAREISEETGQPLERILPMIKRFFESRSRLPAVMTSKEISRELKRKGYDADTTLINWFGGADRKIFKRLLAGDNRLMRASERGGHRAVWS